MFDKCQFSSGMQLLEVYLIHEGTNEEDAAAGSAQKILRRQRVGERVRVQSFALVGDANHQRFAGIFKGGGDALFGIVGVAVEHSVDRCFPDRHGDAKDLVFVDAGFLGHLFGGLLNFIDAVQRGLERVSNLASR